MYVHMYIFYGVFCNINVNFVWCFLHLLWHFACKWMQGKGVYQFVDKYGANVDGYR